MQSKSEIQRALKSHSRNIFSLNEAITLMFQPYWKNGKSQVSADSVAVFLLDSASKDK